MGYYRYFILLADRLLVRVHSYSKLREDTWNRFKFISVKDLDLIKLLEDLLHNSGKFTSLPSIGAKTREIDLRHFKFKNFPGFILQDEIRAERRMDM